MITFSRFGNHGQLGNQMFQYAMLLGVAALQSYKIRIPKNLKKQKKFGLYELSNFNVTATNLRVIDKTQIKNHYSEKGFAFDPGVYEQPDFTDYSGYYQTEKYFIDVADQVRKEFTFISKIRDWAEKYINDKRDSTKSAVVSIHVRRGDYLNRPDLFQVLTPEYYEHAKSNCLIPDYCQYFIFSDDLNWCREHLCNDNTTFVSTPSYIHDLAVMTLCHHHIISASTFSWWGAWLANSHTVIAPYPWFPKGPREDYNMEDIIPNRWIRQEVK